MEPHIGKPESNELPKNSGAITGAYTEKETERRDRQVAVAEWKQGVNQSRRYSLDRPYLMGDSHSTV
ncbi:MAG: hypothetical protein OXM00_07345 [Paracoccaceae bacterium]|nr:hypothetical protein [Paracoccaceae bacterium]